MFLKFGILRVENMTVVRVGAQLVALFSSSRWVPGKESYDVTAWVVRMFWITLTISLELNKHKILFFHLVSNCSLKSSRTCRSVFFPIGKSCSLLLSASSPFLTPHTGYPGPWVLPLLVLLFPDSLPYRLGSIFHSSRPSFSPGSLSFTPWLIPHLCNSDC